MSLLIRINTTVFHYTIHSTAPGVIFRSLPVLTSTETQQIYPATIMKITWTLSLDVTPKHFGIDIIKHLNMRR